MNLRAMLPGSTVPAGLINYLVLGLCTLCALVPAAWVVASSFSTLNDIYSGQIFTSHPNVDGYADLLSDANVLQALGNTAIYAIFGTIGATAVGFLAAYPIARTEFAFREAIGAFFSLTLAVPAIGLLVPEYFIFVRTGLYDSKAGLLLFYVALYFPLAFVISRAYLARIPREIEEAALVDGAGYFTILFLIIAPLSRPALVTVFVIIFINIWNEFLFALVLAPSPTNANVQVALSTFKAQFQFNVTAMLAGASLVMLVPITIFLVMQRQVVSGLTAGYSK